MIVEADPVYNWHIELLCNELQKIAWGVIAGREKEYDLIINIPPGTTKSTICAQMFPAWVWIARLPKLKYAKEYEAHKKKYGKKPYLGSFCRFITGSYAGSLALEHAELSRDLIRSDKYKTYFPEMQIRQDKDAKSNYKNTNGGTRFSTSVGATVTGVHGHFIIIDDPLNPEQAISDAERLTANNWVGRTLSTRKVDKKVTVTIMIMQRLHKIDPTGFLTEKKGKKYRHLVLPGDLSFEVKPAHLKKFYKGGLLDPIRMSRTVLDEMRADLGSYGYSGQVGQDPRPLEGGLFQREWFEIVRAAPAGGTPWVRGWDLAATGEKEAKAQSSSPAFTAGVRMKYVNGVFYIGHVSRFRGNPQAVRNGMKNTASQDGVDTIIDFPQDPGQAGKAQAQDLAAHLVGYDVRYSVESGDKVLRANPFSAQCEAGNVKLVEGDWNEAFLDEGSFFPNGFKDQIDSAVRAFTRLVKMVKSGGNEVGGPAGCENTRNLNPDKAA